MDLVAIRDQLAAADVTGAHGYPRPSTSVTRWPAFVVRYAGVEYRRTHARRRRATAVVTIYCSTAAGVEAADVELDRLASPDLVPAALEATSTADLEVVVDEATNWRPVTLQLDDQTDIDLLAVDLLVRLNHKEPTP